MDDEPEDDDESRTERILARHVAQLSEHFDSVRIFVTRQVPGDDGVGTAGANDGAGNFYASTGLIREWLVCQDHRARLNVEKHDAQEY